MLNGKLCIYANMKLFGYNFIMTEMWKSTLRNKYTKKKTVKSKSTSNKLKEENCFTVKMHYFLQ